MYSQPLTCNCELHTEYIVVLASTRSGIPCSATSHTHPLTHSPRYPPLQRHALNECYCTGINQLSSSICQLQHLLLHLSVVCATVAAKDEAVSAIQLCNESGRLMGSVDSGDPLLPTASQAT
jgi:hypothetical protein